jgi:hypothetical protein
MMGLAGQASASFTPWTEGDLIRVVYNASSGYEEATDLGNAAAIEANPSSLNDSGVNLNSGQAGFTNGTLYVAYFAESGYRNGTTKEFWNSGTLGATETMTGSTGNYTTQVQGAVYNIAYATNGYPSAAASGSPNAWISATSVYAYYFLMDKEVAGGGGFNNFYLGNVGDGDATLAGAGGTVNQSIFDWLNPKQGNTASPAFNVETILLSNGTIETVATATTPIPPSVLLLGSGLLGLIGIGRKNFFNS